LKDASTSGDSNPTQSHQEDRRNAHRKSGHFAVTKTGAMGILHRAVISVFSVKAVPQHGLLIWRGRQRTVFLRQAPAVDSRIVERNYAKGAA
jgi:hypothetical protein